MFTVLQYDGKLEKGSIDDLHYHKVKWIDAKACTQTELKHLGEKIGINYEELHAFSDDKERPSIHELEHYSIFTVQTPNRKGNYTKTSSFAIIVSENLLITIRKHDNIIDEFLAENHEKIAEHFSKGTIHLTTDIMQGVVNDYFKTLEDIEDKINKIENKVFNKPGKKTVEDLFKLKNTLVFFNKGLVGNRDVLLKSDNAKQMKVTAKDKRKLRFIYSDTIQLIDVVATYRDVLTGALDIYLTNVSNNLNITMKKMTAWGSLVLIPTLIASIYGMNFKNMPEIPWEYGYLFSLGLMAVTIILSYAYFKRKDYI